MGPVDGDGRWDALRAVAGDELATWRAAHPRATLTEIEAAVEAALERLRAPYLSAVMGTSAAADPAAAAALGCPDCGGDLRPRGYQTREVLTPGQAAPVRLRRRYLVCARCGAGLFPPG